MLAKTNSFCALAPLTMDRENGHLVSLSLLPLAKDHSLLVFKFLSTLVLLAGFSVLSGILTTT